MKNPLLILGSARKESDTKKVTDILFSDIKIDCIDLLDYKIDAFNYDGIYSRKDDFLELAKIILEHDQIIFATPVYWYSMSGGMKNFFDRLTDLITIHKEMGRRLKGKEVFLVAVGASDCIPDGFENPFRSTSEYLDMKFISTYYCQSYKLDRIKKEGVDFLQKLTRIN